MVTSPVMDVEVTSSTPARSVPQILNGTLQAQLPVYVTSLEIVHNIAHSKGLVVTSPVMEV